jgi:RecA-family ATPase
MPSIYSTAHMAARPTIEREWLVDQWLPARSNAAFGGHGGTEESMLAAMLAVCVGAGMPFYGIAVKRGPVIIYACEDDVDEWKFRLKCAADYLKVDFNSLSVHVVDALESDRDPALFAPPVTDLRADAAVTPVGAWLAEQVKTIKPALVIIDAATDAFAGDEIRRREVRRYLRAMRCELATGGACVVHILHIDKTAARGATSTDLYSGSTDWNNGVRARLAFYRPQQPGTDDEDDAGEETPLRLELQKANYAKRGAFIELRYDEGAHVFVQVGGSDSAPADDLVSALAKRIEEHRILRALAAAEDAGDPVFSGENSRRNAAARLSAADALPKTFRGRAGKTRLFTLLLRLKAAGSITEDSVWTPSKHKAGVWRVTAAGRAEMAAPGPDPTPRSATC